MIEFVQAVNSISWPGALVLIVAMVSAVVMWRA